MYSYSAYGLQIASTLVLPELVETTQRHPDVQIRLDAVAVSPPSDATIGETGWASKTQMCVDIPGLGKLQISHGNEIILQPLEGVDESVYRLFILGAALGVLLHQRGFMVLHASAVVINEGAVVFIGDKGQGKSTMAGALHGRGHPLLADDIVAVDASGSWPRAYPGFPQMKLWPESAEKLGSNIDELPLIRPDLTKRSRVLDHGFAVDSVPVKRVFLLDEGPTDAIIALPPQVAFMSLVQHSYALGILKATGTMAAHFEQAIRVAKTVPIQKLQRIKQFDRLHLVAQMVEESLGSESA